jgi:hypothetical protein
MATPDIPTGKLAQIRQMVVMTKGADPRYVPVVVASVVVAAAVAFGLGFLLVGWILGVIMALLAGLIAFTVVTGRRGQKAAFTKIEGQPGAAFAILQSMRGDWRVTPAVGFNKQQDLVHQAVGRAGVILVCEGHGARARELLSSELRKVRKAIGSETPLHDVVIGEGEGQVPLKRLQVHVMKLPRTLKPKEVNAIDARLTALRTSGALPIPKGPMPTRVPRGKMR